VSEYNLGDHRLRDMYLLAGWQPALQLAQYYFLTSGKYSSVFGSAPHRKPAHKL